MRTKRFITALLSVIIASSSALAITSNAEEKKSAAEIAADIALDNQKMYEDLMIHDADSQHTSSVYYVNFFDIDFDNQLELWVSRTDHTAHTVTSKIFEIKDNSLIECSVDTSEETTSRGNTPVEYNKIKGAYEDSNGDKFFIGDFCSSDDGIGSMKSSYTNKFYLKNTSENKGDFEAYVLWAQGLYEANPFYTIYPEEPAWGSGSAVSSGLPESEFNIWTQDYYANLTDLHLNFAIVSSYDYNELSEEQIRQALIASYNNFSYEGFARDDSNVIIDTDDDTPSDDKTSNGDSSSETSSSDSTVSNAEDTEKYSWKVQPTIEAEDISVLNRFSPVYSTDPTDPQNCDFCTVDSFLYCDYAAIYNNGEWGLISYDGDIVLTPKSAIGVNGNQKWYSVIEDGKINSYNIEGDTANTIREGDIIDGGETGGYTEKDFGNHLFWVDGINKLYVSYDYSSVEANEEHTFAAYLGEIRTMTNGEQQVIPVWNDLGDNEYVLISDGKRVNNEVYENAGNYSDSIIPLKKDGKWGYVDSNGKTVIPFEYDSAYYRHATDYTFHPGMRNTDTAFNSTDNYVVLSQNGEYALYTSEGKEVIPFGELESIRPVYEGMAWAKANGKWGVIELKTTPSENTNGENGGKPTNDDSSSEGKGSSNSSSNSSTTTSKSTTTTVTTSKSTTAANTTNTNGKSSDALTTGDVTNIFAVVAVLVFSSAAVLVAANTKKRKD